MLTIAVNGCPVGREFLTAFMANSKAKHPHANLQLAITAHNTQATVKVEVKSIHYSSTVHVKKWSTMRVLLPPSVEMQGTGSSGKTVRISANVDISVVAFNNKLSTGDSSIVFPTSDLDTDYMIYTPDTSPTNMDKLAAIINGKHANTVEIFPCRKMKIKGTKSWKKGVKVTIALAPYEVYQLRSPSSFTGTRLKAKHPVAILAGLQCYPHGIFCTHIYQQLFPVQKLSTHFLVPVMRNSKDVVHVMAIEDKTKVSIARGKRAKTKDLMAGQTWDVYVRGKIPLVIDSNKKVMVMYYSRNLPYNPFFMSILPSTELSNNWSIDTQASFKSTAVIISEANGVKTTRLDGKKLRRRTKWRPFPADHGFLWTRVKLGRGQRHISITSDALIAVYVYGSKWTHGYSTAGVCYKGSVSPQHPDPCDSVKCREREECQKGVCHHISKATCRAVGDPHYSTFDGKRFNFQGTCTYTMSTTVGKTHGLIPFTILTKNSHRGNKYVSFVRKVTITVYGQTISISNRRGIVEVNGVNSHLPVTLAGGKLHVVRRHCYAVLKTDFGLEVRYDWKTKLYITVTSSYFRSLGGLCGNYNGDRKDEFTTPKGKTVSTILEFAKSWKTKDEDVFCNDDCRGKCPSCSPALQEKYRAENFCGLMAKKDGPFASCHKALEPDMYVDNCVYDVCINKGIKRFLCDNMESYADACNAEGVKLIGRSWRELVRCPMDCPVNSHYDSCGTACPPSCSDLDISVCPKICVEGCQCNKGFVFSGEKCVPKSRCGCTYEGLYYQSGKEFWGDSKCTRRCKCNPNTAKVECSEAKCKKLQVCDLRNGVRDCYPASFASCQASGDPHYRTFDGKRFDFQGTCTYYLSKLVKTDDPALVPFEVRVQNQNRGGNKAVSYTKTVEITVYGNTVILSKESPGKVLLNDQYANVPFQLEDGQLSIFRSGYFGVVKTDFGLTLKFNWDSHVKLTLPSSYSGEVGGLCGNWNGNGNDDMVTPDNIPAKTATIFGDSWKVKDDPGCSSDCGGKKCPECDLSSVSHYQQRGLCGMITDRDGPFKRCHGKVDPKPYFDDCVYDMCLYNGHAPAVCSALGAYTAACQDALAQVAVWRSDSFCPASCKENSHYEVCATGCPATCSELFEPVSCEGSPCAEGCVCDDGFMLSDGECVALAECGCAHGGRYYTTGQAFFPEGLCERRCVCEEGGVVQCNASFSCGPNEKCQVKDGVQACFPDGTGTCSVFGASGYLSFDSRSFKLTGDCVYVLAEVIETDERIFFSVSVKQESVAGEVAATRSVEIKVYEYKITLFPGAIWEAMVDDIKTNLPLSLNDETVKAYQNGMYIIVYTDFGLKVSYDSFSGVIIEVVSTYKYAMRGLCGNYNGDPADDFTLPSGLPAPSVEMFAEAWVVAQEGGRCRTGCGSECPDPDKGKEPDAEKACGILTSKEGPFAACHGAVPPQGHFEECVLEVITWEQDGNAVCRHVQRYAAFCQANGIMIREWRTETFCSIDCPAKSHYELCADTCSSTCASLSMSAKCASCQEGCQCDDGFVFDGDLCVPLESCGCVVNGLYYKSGQSVMQNDCTEICSCKNGVLSCKSTDCTENEICLIKKGVMGCYSTDPCVEKKCREKEDCILEDSKAVCVPQSTAYCWAMGDPHYQTFDGRLFEFQGTCSYTLVKTNGKDKTLPAFSIETKNSMRGNPEGSFVKSVIIKLKGHEIYIPYMEHGKVMIDGIISNIPISLESGSVKITQSGIRGTLKTDFGLEIVFDWISMFMVTVTSSYHDNLAGLCGTYNGVQEDDFTTAGGAVAVNATEWARSWTVADGDPFCWHYCRGPCPTCSEAEQELYKTDKYCGLILKEDGPFSQCHGIVAPEDFVSNCLYDVCLNKGRQTVYCEALASYLGACQEAESTVSSKWREVSNCPWPCPENSHYELCSSPCPATCAEPKGPDNCSLPCGEGCQCDDGLVLSGEKCVPMETGCGCMYDGRYYKPDETFWADGKCLSQCACDRATQTVRCTERGCRENEHCGAVDGVRDCYPTSFKTCAAQGDPHFRSFDGKRFDFQGNCVYQLAAVCSDAAELDGFNVTLENNNRGSRRVSFAKVVTVTTSYASVAISRNYPGKILVDGILTSLPYYLNGSTVRVYRSGRLAVLETHFGLTVTYDWTSSVRVTVPSMYHGATCGLCGNYNGDPADDLLLPGGRRAKNPTEFGDSYLVGEAPGCSRVCEDCASPKVPPGGKPPPYVSDCDVITDKRGPLRGCVGKVDPVQYHENCVYDITLNQGLQRAACDIIAAYVEECQEMGGNIEAWRKTDFCAFPCPANSVYNMTAPGCPATCYSMTSPAGCKAGDREGCQCNPGFLVSDDQCVPFEDCGCSYEERYYKSGSVFYAGGNCRRRCACSNGVVGCEASACGPQETCALADGVRGCYPKGQATCVVSGDSRFLTFDGRGYDFWGPCGYSLAQASKRGLEHFRVSADTEPSEEAVLLESVKVDVFGVSLILERDSPWEIEVDGIHTNLPVSLSDGKLKVSQEGKGIVLQASFGLRLTYDLQSTVSITVPSVYYGQVSGLCGNYNGQPGDDLKLPSGVQTNDLSAFGAAWRSEGDEASCGSACPAGGCAKPGDKEKGELGDPRKCGLIADTSGPLAACHSTLPPAGFLQNCIYNSFIAGGKAESVCQGIEAYVSACQAAGVTLTTWRSAGFCPLVCAAHSHYAVCAHTCFSTCMGLSSPDICPRICSEGCQCDEGFVSDGDRCVPLQRCGCSIDGTYLKNGETVYLKQCSQKCTCSSHHNALCQVTACPPKTHCAIDNGFLGCLPAKSTCILSKDSWVTSFDGQKVKIMGKGRYQLFRSRGLMRRKEMFRVRASFHFSKGHGQSLAGVMVIFGENKVFIFPQSRVRVNKKQVSLPWQSHDRKLSVSAAGGTVSVLYGGKVTVTLRGSGELSVTVPDTLLGHVKGLCSSHRTKAQKTKWSFLSVTKYMKKKLGKTFGHKLFF
ncbi:hypothetical protein SKAU_G00417710 [Synaphobranchus kaupii]|uniref:VWFD domain-containing protein n=1 Tax=Synaphobranchus kaupii TaxID=118154 RepID=A0A9Q1E682_SYNKA|nr:hypothetical protein SKAU_G00417710 [Synaphobranchus kaupii]